MENNNGKTPLSIAKERGHELCEEMVCDTWDNFSYNRSLKDYELIIDSLIHHTLQYLQLSHALQRKKTMFENVNIDWRMQPDDGSTDFSDDDEVEESKMLWENQIASLKQILGSR